MTPPATAAVPEGALRSAWYQAADEHELSADLTAVWIGDVPVVMVRTEAGFRAFDAACPHRGAHLAYGGRLDGDAVVCPFHGKRVGLGQGAPGAYRVREHPVLAYGGMVFVHLGEPADPALGTELESLAGDHLFLPGFARDVQVSAETVAENAFDAAHFRPVHAIANDPAFTVRGSGAPGPFTVSGTFHVPPSPWQPAEEGERTVPVPFTARAFGPYVVVSRLGGRRPYVTFTGATPRAGGGCTVRVAVAVPREVHQALPPDRRTPLYRYLLDGLRRGVEQDVPVWERLLPLPHQRYDAGDQAVTAFRSFCARFPGHGPDTVPGPRSGRADRPLPFQYPGDVR